MNCRQVSQARKHLIWLILLHYARGWPDGNHRSSAAGACTTGERPVIMWPPRTASRRGHQVLNTAICATTCATATGHSDRVWLCTRTRRLLSIDVIPGPCPAKEPL